MKALFIHPGQNLIEHIIPLLKGDGKDYSCNMVVFPGRRPSYFLRKVLAKKLKSSFIPPILLSIDEFIDSVQVDKPLGRKLEAIDAVAILYNIHKNTKNPLGGKGFMSPDMFFPIGLKIFRDIEVLYIEGISTQLVKAIQPYAEEGIPEQTKKRLQALSVFYEEFYTIVGNRGLSTRSFRYRNASEKIEAAGLGKFHTIIFAGFFALTKCETVIFRKLLSLDNTIFLFQYGTGIEEKVRNLGIHAENLDTNGIGPEIHLYRSPDTHGQVFALHTILKDMAQKRMHLDEQTAIVVPSSETLFPLLRQGISFLSEDTYNVSLGYPLYRTPVFGFLNNLMELIISMDENRFYIPDYLKFILHPYTKNIYFNGSAEITRIIFHIIEEKLTKQRTKSFITLPEIEEDDNLFTQIMKNIPQDSKEITREELRGHIKNIHQNTIGKFLGFSDVKDFAVKCMEILTFVYQYSTARLHPLFHPFAESFIRSLDATARSFLKDVSFREISSYFTFFRKYVTTCHIPFEGTPVKGLQVLGFLETRNLTFNRIFFLDVNEETMPDTKREDTLLPFKAREILGLSTYVDRDQLTSYYFETLVRGAQEVHIFFIENDMKEKSRFVERLLWEKQRNERKPNTKQYVKFIQYQVNLENKAHGDIRKDERTIHYLKDFSYNATVLDTYLKCPLQFYYSYVLKINNRNAFSDNIERADIGNFIHYVLSEYFSRLKGSPLRDIDLNIPAMERLIERLFAQCYGKNQIGAVYLLKVQIINHLKDFLKTYYIPLIQEQSVTILDCEYDIRYRTGPFNVKGRIDSIEKRNGRTYIVDYKISANAQYLKIKPEKLDINKRESWDTALGSLQLPFYLMLYSEHTGAHIRDLNGIFLLLGRTLLNRDIELPLFAGQQDTETLYAQLKTVIFGLLDEITDPSIPFTPTLNKKAWCPSCSFQYICGTQWIGKR